MKVHTVPVECAECGNPTMESSHIMSDVLIGSDRRSHVLACPACGASIEEHFRLEDAAIFLCGPDLTSGGSARYKTWALVR